MKKNGGFITVVFGSRYDFPGKPVIEQNLGLKCVCLTVVQGTDLYSDLGLGAVSYLVENLTVVQVAGIYLAVVHSTICLR